MARKRDFEIDINEIQKYYHVSADGFVYSYVSNKWLKPQVNNYGYINFSINKGVPHGCWVSAHRLVAFKYLGLPPTPQHEVDHLDNDKTNNHWSNLEWVTHAENQRRAFRRDGRVPYWKDREKPSPTLETRVKMSDAKKKKIMNLTTNEVYLSIDECCEKLQTYRKKVYRCLRDNKPLSGHYLSYLKEIPPSR